MTTKGTVMNDSELGRFKIILSDKKARTAETIQQLKDELYNHTFAEALAEYPDAYRGKTAPAAINYEAIRRALKNYKISLQKIDAALQRIEEKTYGVCRVTGLAIEKNRLETIPETDLSLLGAQLLRIVSLS